MKKLLLSVMLVSSVVGAQAWTLQEGLIAVANSGVVQATNYAVEPYITYAPQAPSKSKVGGGVFIVYNINEYVGTGLGLDYLGQFSLVSANIQLKVDTHPFKGLTWFGGALTNVAVTPFAIGGLGKATGGTSAGAIAVTDVGGCIKFGHLWGGQFNTGVAWGRWDNAGVYSGPRYHAFVGWSKLY